MQPLVWNLPVSHWELEKRRFTDGATGPLPLIHHTRLHPLLFEAKALGGECGSQTQSPNLGGSDVTSRNSVWRNSKNLLYRELNTGKLTPNQNRKTPTTYFPFIVLVQINLVWLLVNHLSPQENYQDLASFTLQLSFCFTADTLTKKVGFRRLGSILKQNVMIILAPFCSSQNILKGRKHFRYILCIIFHEYRKPVPNAWPPSCPWIMVKMPTAMHRADLSEGDVTLVGVPGSHTLSFGFDYSIKHLFPCSRPLSLLRFLSELHF